MIAEAQDQANSLRLDKWLWFARLARTRSLAARLCAAGCVAVGARVAAKPHHPVRVGDSVTVDLPHHRRVLIVRALGGCRGSAPKARLLYDEPTAPIEALATPGGWTSLFAEEDDAREDQRLTHSL